MRVVLDTSGVVAAWRSRDGASFALFERLRDDEFEIAVSVPLVLEYEAVLLRHLVAGLSRDNVEAFVDYLCARGHKQTVFYLWRPLLNDPGDDTVAEVAVAAACDAIVHIRRRHDSNWSSADPALVRASTMQILHRNIARRRART